MQALTYSSPDDSPLNNARRSYWVARHMLSEANKRPATYDMSLRFWVLNTARNELRNIAHKMRSEQLAKYESYRVTLKGEATEVGTFVKAVSRGHALSKAQRDYPGFKVMGDDHV